MSFKLTLTCFIIATVLTAQAARLRPGSLNKNDIPEDNYLAVPKDRDPERVWKDFLQRRSCVALGGEGCASNNGRCCRKGNPYTGEMRKCRQEGTFFNPKYVCRET